MKMDIFTIIYNSDITQLKNILNGYTSSEKIFYVNKVNYDGDSPLIVAVRKSNISIITILIDNGADVNYENYDTYSTPLKEALLLWVGKNIDNQIKLIKYLVHKGANVNHVDRKGEFIICTAIRQENIRLAKLLIFLGADINLITKQYENDRMKYSYELPDISAWNYFNFNSRPMDDSFLRFMLQQNINIPPEILSCLLITNSINEQIVRIPYNRDFNPHEDELTQDDIDIVEEVINNGYLAILNYWNTYLDYSDRSYLSFVSSYIDNNGNTALHKAILNSNNPALIDFLINTGLSLNKENNYGITPLMLLKQNQTLYNMYNSRFLKTILYYC
jgi:ankyrin repeat protein